jgi:hypothetical protein
MIIRLRAGSGATRIQATDAAVGRGMADLLAALDTVIDDDAALRRTCARVGKNAPCAAQGRGAAAVADQVQVRIGMAGPAVGTARARRPARSRRRPALLLAVGAAAALAGGAVALIAVLMPGAGNDASGRPAVNTAYVVKRITSALSAADPGDIAQMTVTTRDTGTPGARNVTTTAKEWSYGDEWRSVTYSAAGHLVYDQEFSTASGYTVVNYRTRTWARQRGLGGPARLAPGPRGCAPVVADLPLLLQPGLAGPGLPASWRPATVARALRGAISCGSLAVAGRQRLDGTEALELTSSPDSPIPETIWVSPDTYLPVRVVIRPAAGTPGPSQTADISWLRPSAQNLARLTLRLPAGFRQVPLAEAVPSIAQRVRAWTKI